MFGFFRKRKSPTDAIMALGPADYLDLSQCFSNIFISGQVGSGKTTGPGANLAIGLLAHPSHPGALILCQKPDEADRWKSYCQLTGRSRDVIHVRLGGPHVIDLLDYTISGPGGIEEAKAMWSVIMEAANRNRPRNSSDAYWGESSERAMGNSAALTKMATGRCSFGNLYSFIQSLPNSREQLLDPEWRTSSFAAGCITECLEKHRHTRAVQLGFDWVVEWAELSDKTRSIIYSVCVNTLDKFLAGKFADLISANKTTFTPEMALEDGRIIIFDVPGSVFGSAAVWASVSVKLLFQKAAMRRNLTKECRPLILWADEAANFCVPEIDAMFLSQSRQFRAIVCNIVQNIPLVITALGSNEAARHQAYAWISNHALIIAAANTSPEDCELYSKMAGETREVLYGGSTGGHFNYDLVADVFGQPMGNANVSWNQQIRPSLPPHVFAAVATGGPPNYVVEAYCLKSGRLFSNGKVWVKGSWRQIV